MSTQFGYFLCATCAVISAMIPGINRCEKEIKTIHGEKIKITSKTC